jgi:aspartyl protease family protein
LNCSLTIVLAGHLPCPAKYVEETNRISAAFAGAITNAQTNPDLIMRVVIPVAIVALVACAIVPRYAGKILAPSREAAAVVVVHPPSAAQSSAAGSRSVVIAPSRGGHFRVSGRIDGRRVDFMVDTGASVIALKPEDAAMLGIRPAGRDYIGMVGTANGTVRVAPVQLGTVEVDDLEVHNVAAMVMPSGALNENLLGLSFLRRLRRFEFANGKLVLEQ